ncbi:MAG: ABC transporter permease, partial [Ruminococcus sp.]|nr:ABC transporter permease [Ruminococcus sp.]
MTLYYGIKQILRSPLKSILFLLLAGVSTFLLVLGSSLWEINRTMLEEFEDLFMTVGTVEQKIDHVETYKIWDA